MKLDCGRQNELYSWLVTCTVTLSTYSDRHLRHETSGGGGARGSSDDERHTVEVAGSPKVRAFTHAENVQNETSTFIQTGEANHS